MSVEPIEEKKVVRPENLIVTMIDDEEVGHFIFQKLANGIPGIETAVFQNAKTVIELIRQDKFKTDLILLDINMPVMDGFEFLNSYKTHTSSDPVIVVLTTSSNENDINKLENHPSVMGYLNKPLTAEKINLVLEKHFS